MSTGRARPIIQFDPFYDGDGSGQVALPAYAGQAQLAPGATPIVGNVRGTTRAGAGTPNPAAYHDVGAVSLIDGRPMAAGMRGGTAGLRGTIIPRATPGGVPAGVRPHAVRNMELQIDPHIRGQSSRIRLGDLTESIMRQADQLVDEAGIPEAASMEDIRFRGAAAMHAAAQLTGAPPVEDYQEDGGQPMPESIIPARHLGRVAQPARGVSPNGAGRRASPLQAFNQPPQEQALNNEFGGREFRAIDMSHVPTPIERGAPPPNVRVVFEVEHFGTHNARYHEVLRHNGFVVLVWRTDYQQADPWWPQAKQDAPPLGLQVEGDNTVYLVHTTGIQYVYGNVEYCVLMVERTAQNVSQ